MRDQIILILFLLFSQALLAQQPLNFDFEMPSIEGLQRPWGWELNSWGTSYFSMDSTEVRTGRYSLHSQCRDAENCTRQTLSFGMEPFEMKGKTISLQGYVKGKGIEKAVTCSVMYTMYDEESGAYIDEEIETESSALSQTFDWKRVAVEVKIPASVVFVQIWMNHEGQGEAWFDDFQLSIAGKEVKELQIAELFGPAQISWLTERASPFASYQPLEGVERRVPDDFPFFKEAVGDSKIIALGESTHGTSEFFALKHRLLQYAVEELGFRAFAIEDHLVVGQNINEYITTGAGTLREAMAGAFNVWSVQEVGALIEWMRAYNEAHPEDRLTFIGFDIQNVGLSIKRLAAFLEKQDADWYSANAAELNFLQERGEQAFMIRDTVLKMEWIERSEKLYQAIAAKRGHYLSMAKSKEDSLRIEYGVQYANLVKQYFRMSYKNDEALYRDVAMSNNVAWYLERIDPGAKMVIWAHDVHISRGEHPQVENNLHLGVSMGSFLAKKYPADYKSFGIWTHAGTYRAYKTYAYRSLIDSPLFTSPRGSWEEALHQVSEIKRAPNLYFSLDRTQKWLNQARPIRFANHVSFDYGFWPRYSIPYQFDGIFFIDKTSSAKNLQLK